jgi:prephenate dehydratase
MKSKTAYQGIPGSYSHLAVKKYFAGKAITFSCSSFALLFSSVLEKRCKYGMVPVLNSTTGKIKPTQSLLKKNERKVLVIDKISLRISHCLLTYGKTKISNLTSVYSHPQALLQCQGFFKKYPFVKPVKYADTAASGRLIALLKKKKIAAIASSKAAKIYKLNILKKDIQTNKKNYTHFYIISLKGGDNYE